LFSHYTPIYIAFHYYADKGSALLDSTPLSKPVLKALPSKLSSQDYFKIIMKVTQHPMSVQIAVVNQKGLKQHSDTAGSTKPALAG
jgi:hypothetical protein